MPLEPSAEDQNQNTDSDTDAKTTSVESSSAGDQDVKKPATILDRFDAALKKDSKAGGSSTSQRSVGEGSVSDPAADGKTPEGEKPKDGEGEDSAEATDDELKPRTKRRIERLLREKKEAVEAAVAQLKPQAEAFVKVQQFCHDAGLTKDEVNNGFEIMRLMKHDPLKALEALKPYYDSLLQVTGSILPEDLQQKVNQGLIDEETAREAARLRAVANIREQQLTRVEQSSTAKQQTDLVESVAGAVSQWERNWEQSDPDYKTLQPYVMGDIELALRRGQLPKDPQTAVQMVEEIKKRVVAKLGKFRGAKPAITPLQGGQQIVTSAKPKTMVEALSQALAG